MTRGHGERRRRTAASAAVFFRIFVSACLGALSASAWASDKKGVGVWEPHASEHLAQLHAAWYYTWSPRPVESVSERFVPMIWGGARLEAQLNGLPRRALAPVLLAINEPDERKQANMSVQQVVRIWPRLSRLADRISSPATEHARGPWIDRFLRVARRRHLKLSFMAVHLYGGTDSRQFLARLDAVHRRYRMPIWLTEFGVADWDTAPWARKSTVNRYNEDSVLQFMKEVLPELEKRPYVMRYAWFGAGDGIAEELRTSRLFEKDGTLTPLGRYYADFQN